MRQAAVEHAVDLFHRYQIDTGSAVALEVGGTRRVWLETSHYVPSDAQEPDAGSRAAQLSPELQGPRPEVIVTDNPLLRILPHLKLLDYGFNADALGTSSDTQADFLDEASIARLADRYDLVLSFDTLEHVSDPFAFCHNLVRVARPGGSIYLATVFGWEYHPSPKDYWRFSPDGLRVCFAGTPARMLECNWHVFGVSVFAWLQKVKK
jgi:hypothetical protein